MNQTEQILIGMLQENTGTHMLDSGGDLNRHWQRNQVRTFINEPASLLKFSLRRNGPEIEYTRNVFHYLRDRLEFNPELDKEFQQFYKDNDYYPLEAMEEFCGQNEYDHQTVNTYNGECNLSQTLQFTTFGHGSDLYEHDYVLLQIHNGCDVRGGYTMPKVFTRKTECALYDVADGEISCPHCRTYWSTDDSYHWYREGSCGCGAGTQLENYDAIEGEAGVIGQLVINDKNQAFCPVCGQGILGE